MKVLVIGGGGREHALCWKIAQSTTLTALYCAPGNAGTAALGENVDIAAGNIEALLAFAREKAIDLTVVGPEAPLCAGIVDAFAVEGLAAFGPTADAARIEGSKAFAKRFLQEHGIPTAPFGVFTDAAEAEAYIDGRSIAQVVKADGLAAGKGVIVCRDAAEAKTAAREILIDRRFGDAGAQLLIEDRLDGEEASFMALCDGERVVPLASSQDHKRALDGDRGPNTGGMGAYSPAPIVTPAMGERIMREVMRPLAEGLAAAGSPYRGLIYAGLMIDGETINVLEINCRFGDPETQPVLARLREDLVPLLQAAAAGELEERALDWDHRPALCVVLASGGYPGSYDKGHLISGLDTASALPDVVVFHAGTARSEDGIVTAGGRVLGVTGLGRDLHTARDRAYDAAAKITWPEVHFRRDIGRRALT